MKRTILLTALLITVIGGALAQGNQSDRAQGIKLIEGENDIHYLIYPFKNPGKVRITFLDENGKILARDWVRNKIGFKKRYDLSPLQSGSYTMEIVENGQKIRKQFLLGGALEAALVDLSNNRYRVLVDSEVPGAIDLKIYDRSRNLLFADTQSEGFSRVYDLGDVPNGPVYFELEKDGKAHTLRGN